MEWPAQIPGVVAVAATAPGRASARFPFRKRAPDAGFDGKTVHSNLGGSVALFAPGGTGGSDLGSHPNLGVQSQMISVCSGIRPGCEGGRLYTPFAGTSMAAPHAAGVAALIAARATAPRGVSRTQAVERCLASMGDVTAVSGYVHDLRPVQSDAVFRMVTRPRVNARASTPAERPPSDAPEFNLRS